MTARSQFRRCARARAIALLRTIYDTLEFDARAPGDRIEISRQDLDSTLNDIRIVEKLIGEMEND